MDRPPLEDPQTFAIIAAALAVFRTMGGGLREQLYQRALAIEFEERAIPAVPEPNFPLFYRDRPIGHYRPDFVCYDSIIVELKAHRELASGDYAQTMQYLLLQGSSRALLMNFAPDRLRWKRFDRLPG